MAGAEIYLWGSLAFNVNCWNILFGGVGFSKFGRCWNYLLFKFAEFGRCWNYLFFKVCWVWSVLKLLVVQSLFGTHGRQCLFVRDPYPFDGVDATGLSASPVTTVIDECLWSVSMPLMSSTSCRQLFVNAMRFVFKSLRSVYTCSSFLRSLMPAGVRTP